MLGQSWRRVSDFRIEQIRQRSLLLPYDIFEKRKRLLAHVVGEFGIPHASEVAARAGHEITHGKYAPQFWWGSVVAGHVVPIALLAVLILAGLPMLAVGAALFTAVGLYAYEHAFVMAPQEIPNS